MNCPCPYADDMIVSLNVNTFSRSFEYSLFKWYDLNDRLKAEARAINLAIWVLDQPDSSGIYVITTPNNTLSLNYNVDMADAYHVRFEFTVGPYTSEAFLEALQQLAKACD